MDNEADDFSVTLSGKSSKKVDGLYKPDTKEIILHNGNFQTDNELIYTAIHEFAHHVQFTKAMGQTTSRAHTIQFWSIFHKLLYKAEELGIYENIFVVEKEFVDLTVKIKEAFLYVNGQQFKEFGKLLISAVELCRKFNTSYEDYFDRILGIQRNEAKTLMKTYSYNVDPSLSYETMKAVTKIKDPEKREEVQNAFLSGNSYEMVKSDFLMKPKILPDEKDEKMDMLEDEKHKILVTISKLQNKLKDIEKKISDIKGNY